jgi:hypothetical protein
VGSGGKLTFLPWSWENWNIDPWVSKAFNWKNFLDGGREICSSPLADINQSRIEPPYAQVKPMRMSRDQIPRRIFCFGNILEYRLLIFFEFSP